MFRNIWTPKKIHVKSSLDSAVFLHIGEPHQRQGFHPISGARLYNFAEHEARRRKGPGKDGMDFLMKLTWQGKLAWQCISSPFCVGNTSSNGPFLIANVSLPECR